MLQSPLKPLTELTGCTKSSIMSCLPFGSAAQIQCVTTVFSPVQFLAYMNVHSRWCVALRNGASQEGKHQDKLVQSERNLRYTQRPRPPPT